MKKYLKLQAKKSMSLFLAVLMLLSCWVWVAPTEAEAAKFTPLTQYTVKVKWQLADRAGKYTGGNIKYKTLGDGWGSESSEQTAISSLGDCLTNNKTYEKTFTTTSFPSVVKITYEGGNTEWGALTQDGNKARCEVLEILINDKTVWKGNTGYNGANSAEVYCTNGDGAGDAGNAGGTYTWQRPRLAGFNDDTASASDIAVTLNQIGGQDITKTADYNIAKYTCYNQYGVKISDPTNYINNGRVAKLTEQTTYVSTTKNSDDGLSGEDATDIYATANDKDTVVIKPNLQISNPKGTTGAATYYLVRKYVYDDTFGGSITSKVSAKIDVTYPNYTVTFNGGVSTAKITADKEYTGSYAAQGYHGTNITVPSKTTADGYTFYEYWSKPQPATGAASYNAAAADFAQPCSSEDYASYMADGGKEENGIVTDKEGGKWYDAGMKLDPSSAKTIDVSDNKANFVDTWYAWWLAKDLSVKFYDVDGAFLGEKLVKSGQTQSAITWPTSKYINSGYNTGAFKFTVDANIWETTDGTEINKNSYTFTKDLILTPKLTRKSFQSKYTVTFINPNNGDSVGVGTDGTYDYRADIKSYADTAKNKIAAVPSDVDGDLQYRYELLGWSSVAPTTGKNYHILLEDADFDVNGTAIGLNKDWVVRNDATYYPVYRRYTQTYVVNFTYKDATGADATRQLKFKYGDKLVAPTEYVPYNYVTKGFGYEFENWQYTNADGAKATFTYKGEVAFTSENFEIAAAALDDGEEVVPIVVKAAYGDGVPTPYSVTFNYVDNDGEDVSNTVTVNNEELILKGTVDNLTPAEKWENEDQLYTYADKWEITEGAATVGVGGAEKKVGDIIDTADLITLTPTSNVTFKAVYANPVPYFTVTYIDGTQSFKDRVLKGSNVPEWTHKVNNDNGTPDDTSDDFEEDKIYVPADYEGDGGTYEFQGWFDAATGGNKVTTADKVTSNLTLYSQFKFVPDTFTIKFMNHDGSVQLAAGKYEKGQNIEALVTVATKAAQGRAEDDTYKYLFLGWDKAVPTFCEGYDVTYTALYKPVYKYYDVKWYNSRLVDGKWVADKSISEVDGETVETYLLATTHHTFNSKLHTPSVGNIQSLTPATDGQEYVFAGWYYNDADGNAVKYERGMTVTANMEFYATFNLSAETHTVTTVVKGETAKYEVADGNKAVIPDPQAGYIGPANHDAFAGWYTDAEYTTAFDADTEIKADTKIYAKFEVSAHTHDNEELITAPTYYVMGEMKTWCSCDRAKTEKTKLIPMLTDTKVPTGTIYLGGLGQWNSTDAIGGADLDKDENGNAKEITIYANANTDVIVTANDTGDENALYNPAGIGKGIKVIRAFIYPGKFETLTADSYGAAQSLTVDVYNDDTQALTNNANFAVKLGDFVVADLDADGKPQYENGEVKYKKLESGESYIVYYYVVDKADNQLRQKVRTAKFIYDDTAPVFGVTGESNGATVPTYCGSVTVTGVEADAVLTVNGAEVTHVDGEYVINYAEGMDNVIITATDKAGNTYSKKVKLADHSYITTEQAASCGVAGYKKVECIICDDVKSEEPYAALDHIWSDRQVIPADCVNNGIVVVTCSICGEKVETKFEEDGVTPVIPAEGHEYAKDADGNIIYTTVTESTCKTKGLAEAYCSVCGEGRTTKELDLNPEKHEDITITEVEADCVNDGYYTETCSCGATIKSETYPATGHGNLADETAEWYVRTEPTCYQTGEKVLKCLKCSNFIKVDGVEVTEEIEATGKHVKTVTNPDTYKEDGFVYYHCATEGCDHKYEPKEYVEDVTKEYTVTFKTEDGTLLGTFTVVEGSSIQKDAVVAPEKANSTDGKFKYTFAGWTDGEKTYKLPLTPTANLELKATYKESKIMYTHKFSVQNTWVGLLDAEENTYVTYATLVGAVGDERVPSGTPVFTHKNPEVDAQLKKLYTFEFKGWKNADGVLTTDFTVGAEDVEFTAYFEAIPLTYKVTYYNGTEFVWQKNDVKAGDPVVFGGTAPTKTFDDAYHYTFSGKWYTDATLKTEYKGEGITADTRLYAGFTAKAHSYDKSEGTVTQKADCVLPEIKEYACACGHKIEEETADALGHDLSEPEYDSETGKLVQKCKRTGCDYEVSEDASFTIRFENWDGKRLAEVKVESGKDIFYNFEENGTPARATDDQYGYVFAGWKQVTYDEAGNAVLGETLYEGDHIFEKVSADATYRADYTTTDRYYTVSYVDVDNKVLQTAEIKYGEAIPEYAGKEPTKAYDDNYHYEFTKWSVESGTIVTTTLRITPEFKAIDHNYKSNERPATCTQVGGIYKECACGHGYLSTTEFVPKTPHEWKEVNRTEPNHNTGTDGSISYKCKNCDATKEEKIPAQSVKIELKVVDTNKNPVNGAVVYFYDSKLVEVAKVTTGEDGIARFIGPVDEYTYSVVVNGKEVLSYEDAKDGASSTPAIKTGEECSCSCHRQNFWGIIFRLLQKFIKLFTGKIGCCSCPDPAYK